MKFLKNFGVELDITPYTKGKYVYAASHELQKIAEGIDRDPFSIGLLLGEQKREFVPSFALLDMLKSTKNKVMISNEWFFLCKRDVFEEHILDIGEIKDVFLVVNEKEEVLGLGKFYTKRGKKFIKPVLDRGDFLRRER